MVCYRTGCKVLTWDDPYDSIIYSIASDNLYTILCGVGVNGRVHLWDKRHRVNIGVCINLSQLHGIVCLNLSMQHDFL
jgi:hypothetical protein